DVRPEAAMKRISRAALAVCLAVVQTRLIAQSFRERVDVELVRVDLLATDGKGNPVQGLRAEDLQVKVDGKPVKLDGFEAPGAQLAGPSGQLPELPVGTARLPAGPPASRPPDAEARPRYYMAVLADETSSEQSNRHATYKEVFQFLEEPLSP